MKKLLEYNDIDSLTAVELPDRNVVTVCLLIVDASGNTLNVLSFNDIATAVNVCGQQINATVLSIFTGTDQTQWVDCQAWALA